MEKKDIKFLADDTNMTDLFRHIFDNAFGKPIPFSSAPSLSDMKPNTWGYNSTNLYVCFEDGTGISIAGVAMS